MYGFQSFPNILLYIPELVMGAYACMFDTGRNIFVFPREKIKISRHTYYYACKAMDGAT
jgi:hypothetical protein